MSPCSAPKDLSVILATLVLPDYIQALNSTDSASGTAARHGPSSPSPWPLSPVSPSHLIRPQHPALLPSHAHTDEQMGEAHQTWGSKQLGAKEDQRFLRESGPWMGLRLEWKRQL